MSSLVLEKEEWLGRFIYEDLNDGIPVQEKEETQISGDTKYTGQWSTAGHRHGRGVMIWEDGAKYEGTWKNDRAEGKGRLIHSDGDVYEGLWQGDKANG